MATITAAMVKDLRETTGVGMMDCKQALSENNGDMQAAIDWLRKKGLSKAAKKAGRVAAEGLIEHFQVTMEISGARINGLYRWRAGIVCDRVFLAAVYQQRIQGPGFLFEWLQCVPPEE